MLTPNFTVGRIRQNFQYRTRYGDGSRGRQRELRDSRIAGRWRDNLEGRETSRKDGERMCDRKYGYLGMRTEEKQYLYFVKMFRL